MHHRLSELKAERFVADWFDEHFEHEGAEYETGEWARYMACPCSEDAAHTVEIRNAAHEKATAGHKAGARTYSWR